jgi:hypothetical protein
MVQNFPAGHSKNFSLVLTPKTDYSSLVDLIISIIADWDWDWDWDWTKILDPKNNSKKIPYSSFF